MVRTRPLANGDKNSRRKQPMCCVVVFDVLDDKITGANQMRSRETPQTLPFLPSLNKMDLTMVRSYGKSSSLLIITIRPLSGVRFQRGNTTRLLHVQKGGDRKTQAQNTSNKLRIIKPQKPQTKHTKTAKPNKPHKQGQKPHRNKTKTPQQGQKPQRNTQTTPH